MRDIDPMNPAALQEALEGGLFEPEKTPAQQAALARLETTLALVEGWVDEVVGQATEERMPDRRQAPGGGPPPPRRRRTRRVDVRLAGRARAAAAPPARRLRAVGLAAPPQGARGPRRRLGAPRPAAHGRRPRRPARLPRGPQPARSRSPTPSSTPRSPTCSTARHGGDEPDGPDAPRAVTAGRCTPMPSRRCCGWHCRPTPRRSGCAARTSTTSARTRTGSTRTCFPDHLTAGTLVLSADGSRCC